MTDEPGHPTLVAAHRLLPKANAVPREPGTTRHGRARMAASHTDRVALQDYLTLPATRPWSGTPSWL